MCYETENRRDGRSYWPTFFFAACFVLAAALAAFGAPVPAPLAKPKPAKKAPPPVDPMAGWYRDCRAGWVFLGPRQECVWFWMEETWWVGVWNRLPDGTVMTRTGLYRADDSLGDPCPWHCNVEIGAPLSSTLYRPNLADCPPAVPFQVLELLKPKER